MAARGSCVAVRARKKKFDGGFVNDFIVFVIRLDNDILKILETNVLGRVRNTNNFTAPKCNNSPKIKVSKPKTYFSSCKAELAALSSLRRVKGPERKQTVSARRDASNNAVQNF